MSSLQHFIHTVNICLSDYVLIILLSATGIFFTFATKFVQVRCFGEAIRNIFSNPKGKKGEISSFQALATSVGAQIGTGNIIGASGAILTGGPGALFWMWIISFLGMATIYAEAVLSIETRKISKDGIPMGGPVYYIKKAFPGKRGKYLAGFFALATVLALGFMGAMVQSNAISAAAKTAFGISPEVSGIITALLAGAVFFGGAKGVASVSGKLVPFMSAMYLGGSLIVLICRIAYIPESFALIFRYAFQPQSIIGGGFGIAMKTTVSQGVKRGLFSNEAGMGSTPHAHAAASVNNPHAQGTVAMLGVFIDTLVLLTLTGLVAISTLYAGNGPLSEYAVKGASEGINQNNMISLAIGSVFGNIHAGNISVALCLFFFAFSSIISWNYFGRINSDYLFGKKLSRAYTLASIVFTYLGAVLSGDMVWELTDMFNQLMVIPNVMALWKLSSIVIKYSRRKQ